MYKRQRQISIALSTAASGIAIWLYALSWHRNGSYHTALFGSGVFALCLAVLDFLSLAKPDLLESIVRRAPTWEQKLANRQRTAYNSNLRGVKHLAAMAAARTGIGSSSSLGGSIGVVDEEGVRQAWVDATLEPVNQANPILPAAEK